MTEKEFADRSLGNQGATYETGTTALTGKWCAIQALEDTVLASVVALDWEGDARTSVPIPAGCVIFGQFSAYKR